VQRALPDVRDGLKPVHRRVLYAMHKLGLSHQARFSKSAKVVGEVLGKYHPHGDAPVYDALVRMAQEFSLRYRLVLGQGNFGSIDGDPPAAMRYTEVKLTKISDELLTDIEKDTVAWGDNFDATLKEPLVLPARIPNLLLMGAEGIAVGMATRIPPHNITEVLNAVIHMIDSAKEYIKTPENTEEPLSSISYIPPFEKDLLFEEALQFYKEPETTVEIKPQIAQFDTSLDQLMSYVTGPDFPTGAFIYGHSDIKQAYATGRGKILVRAKVELEELKNGRQAIIVDQLPYQVNKANLIKKIADLVHEKRLLGIADLRDESDRDGIRVVIEVKRDAIYNKVLNNLYKYTELQTSYPVNMVTLVDNTPQTVSLQTILEEFIKHRVVTIKKRSIFELKAAKRRAHILEGLLKALDHIDEIIAIIKKAKDESLAKEELVKVFDFSYLQAQAILDMQLKRLTGLERAKIEDELKALQDIIDRLESLIKNVFNILDFMKKELLELIETYGDARRTKVFKNKPGELGDEELIENKPIILTLTQEGYVKTVPMDTYKVQHRGGKGVSGMTTKDEDAVAHITSAMTHDFILFFTDKGKVYQVRVWDVPAGSRTSKGKAIVNLLSLAQNEHVTSMLPISSEMLASKNGHAITMCTKLGTIKKSALSEFANIKSSGLIAIRLQGDDQLLWAQLTDSTKHIMLATKNGQSIVFKATDVRLMGRATQGVRAINLSKEDEVKSMNVIDPADKELTILVLSEKGIGKQTKITLFPIQKRGGKGVKIATVDAKTGPIIFSSVIDKDKEALLITSKQGQVVKITLSTIPRLSRVAKGVIVMRFTDKEETISSATFV
ncbi:MAG: DNA gyrase subunit A, partial [Candidatus Roizmanbacteria bacterium]